MQIAKLIMRQDISKLRKNRGIYFNIGMICSLSFALFAFNYTVYDVKNEDFEIPTEILDPEIEVIRTKHEEKPLPPPPKLDVSDEILEMESPEFIEEPLPEPVELPLEVEVKKTVEAPPAPKPIVKQPKPKSKPKVIPKEEIIEEPLYTIVENMPEFGNCGESKNRQERRKLSDKNLLAFIYKNIKYPRLAIENGIQGRVIVRFVINKKGKVQNAEILREPGGGLGKEVLRVVNKMPLWTPGKQGLRNVKVQYTMPVEFKPI